MNGLKPILELEDCSTCSQVPRAQTFMVKLNLLDKTCVESLRLIPSVFTLNPFLLERTAAALKCSNTFRGVPFNQTIPEAFYGSGQSGQVGMTPETGLFAKDRHYGRACVLGSLGSASKRKKGPAEASKNCSAR